MDENIDGPVIDQLRKRGVAVLTVQEDGLSGVDDERVLARATELGRLLYTNDSDLLVIAKLLISNSLPFPGVVYARKTEITTGEAVEGLELIATLGEPEEFANRVIYLPWR